MTTSKLNRLFFLWVVVFGCAFAEPAWLEGKPMNQWFEINGTSGAGGSPINPWGGFTLREDTTELFIAASGGHGDSYDNRVVSIKLTDDQPQWIMRHEPTPQDLVVQNVPYYKDGLPTSRHSYQHNLWVPAVNRIMLCGAYGVYGGGWAYPTIDGFNPDTNQWDPAGTWPNITRGYGAIRETNSSIVWANGLVRIDFEKKEQTQPITKTANVFTRWPWAHDTRRHQLFTLQFGDGQGYDTNLGIQSSRIPLNPGDTQYKVTFKNSSALDLFISEAPVYSAMDYDPVNDRFLFYYGQLTSAGRIYVITPNDGSDDWEMSILPLADGSAIPPAVPGSGINKRFLYVPGLNVFVMQPFSDSNIWFIRVGNFEQIPQTAPYVAPPQSMNSPQSTNSPQSSSSPQSSNVPKARTSDVTQVTSSLAVLLILCGAVLMY